MLIDTMIFKNKMLYDTTKLFVIACHSTVQAAIKGQILEFKQTSQIRKKQVNLSCTVDNKFKKKKKKRKYK